MNTTVYDTPFKERYASKEMLALFSPDKKFTTWRKLWVALAEAEQELGLNITDAQIQQMKDNISPIDYDYAKEVEKKFRHDVMAHIHAYGKAAPDAMPIIHLGATSCYVGDNTDLIILREAMRLLHKKLVNAAAALGRFANEYKALPCLGFTHLQPAQPTTVGKRASLWIQDLLLDEADLAHRQSRLRLLGSKGTTGTQASFLELFAGDHAKVKALDDIIAKKMGFPGCYPVTGQTYSRKVDSQALSALSGIAQSAAKFSGDLRLLQHMKEIEEPFEESQVGSSAMAYKRNPMRCERIAGLARYVISTAMNPAMTASAQWLERTLDDSANKRIAIPEAFLATDAILELYLNVAGGLVVYPKMIEKRLFAELPFLATENILMDAVKRGGDRQELHERIRVHSQAAARQVKLAGGENDLLERIAEDPAFDISLAQLQQNCNPASFIGRAPEQTAEFLAEHVYPLLERHQDWLGLTANISV